MKTRDDRAAFYEATRGDSAQWSAKAVKAKVRRPGSIVFSIRFSKDELEEVRVKAESEGLKVSEFIRRATLEYPVAGAAASFRILGPEQTREPSAWAIWDVGSPSGTRSATLDQEPVTAG
jgi:hypothetical protein